MPVCRRLAFAVCLAAAAVAAPPLHAAEDAPQMQMLFVGASSEAGLQGAPAALPVIAIPTLPPADAVRRDVFAARLRANSVSTFVSDPSGKVVTSDQLILVARTALTAGREGARLTVGRESLPLSEFSRRLEAAVAALGPRHRSVGLVHIADEGDRFPMVLAELQDGLTGLGFDMLVMMIAGQAAEACPGAQPLHFSLAGGLADRAPFGDADGISVMAEAERYLSAALTRAKTRGCGPAYSLILKASDDPAQKLIAHGETASFAAAEKRLHHETFEAMFLLESQDGGEIRAFLESCVYCPNEQALNARLRSMGAAMRTAELEAEIWARIKDDDTRERLAIYLQNCVLCQHQAPAQARIAEIDAVTAARAAENRAFRKASESRDLPGLRAYFETCVACEHLEKTEALIAEIEQDETYRAERALLTAAVEGRDAAKLEAYLQTCTVCDGQAEVAATLDVLQRLAAVRGPCLTQAGLPQHGGPRRLDDIDRDAAQAACTAAERAFPDDGLTRTLLGRIAQAGGDHDRALAAYEYGIEKGVAAAFGLAAYARYAPAGDGVPDLAAVEDLALQGVERGDWLSHEILTVIYSKGLLPGRTGAEAFRLAMAVAEEGNALAQFFVGYYYLTGTGTEPSDTLAETWLRKSVEQGYTHAFSFLAELHERGGEAREPQPDRAADLYWTALEKGDPTATDRLTTQLGDRDAEVVRHIQERLREAGLYRGRVDGVPGPGTANAIREYADRLTGQG